MIIIQSEINPNQLIIRFTSEEQQNSLYTGTLNQLKTVYPEITENMTDIIIDNITNIGQTVDSIRELFCGDVLFEYDNECNQLPKDLSNNTQFILGATNDVDPIQEDI